MGAANAMHIIPSHANNNSPVQNTSSVKYALFRAFFLVTPFLSYISGEAAPITKGSQTNKPYEYSLYTSVARYVNIHPNTDGSRIDNIRRPRLFCSVLLPFNI